MLRKVKLYGELADFIGHKELDAVINSTADAVSFLITNFPKVEAHMSDRYYQVLVGDNELEKEISVFVFQKGNIIYWKGHVAVCINSEKLI